jgi:hypothetical protein
VTESIEIKRDVLHKLTVVFEHVLLEEPAPRNVYAAAATRLGVSEDAVKRMVERIRNRINDHRGRPLRTVDEIGHYLVHVARVVTDDELQP